MVACCTSDAALGGPFLAKTRYHIACGRRKTACSPVWDLFVRLQKPLLNDDYAARRSICAFSAVEGMWAVRADCVVLRRFDECDSQRRLCDPTEPLLLRGGGVCRPPGRTSESRCSSNTAQTPTMLWRGHMLMILARLVRSESFWAVVKVRSPHTGREPGYVGTLELHKAAQQGEAPELERCAAQLRVLVDGCEVVREPDWRRADIAPACAACSLALS